MKSPYDASDKAMNKPTIDNYIVTTTIIARKH